MLPKEASEVLAFELAKRKKPFTDAAVYRDIFSNILEKMGKKEAAKLLQEIPCSRTTMARQSSKISNDVWDKLKEKLNSCSFVSICLDETTDVTDESQLLIYVRGVSHNKDVFEEMLELQQLKTKTTGSEVFTVVMATLQEFNIIDKLFNVTTDGAQSLCGHITGLYGRMSEVIPGVRHYHCLLHKLALSGKYLSNFPSPKKGIQIINALRGGHNSLTHRRLKRYLEESKASHKDLLMYTEVRWLSRGKSLRRLFDLRSEITSFVHSKDVKINEELKKLTRDKKFWNDIAFFTDISAKLNELNLSLQGHNSSIMDHIVKVDEFVRMLKSLQKDLNNNRLENFPACQELNCGGFKKFYKMIGELVESFSSRFSLYDEVRGMRPNSPEYERFLSTFPTTYSCEQGFSMLKLTKAKERSNLCQANLTANMRLCLSKNVENNPLAYEKRNAEKEILEMCRRLQTKVEPFTRCPYYHSFSSEVLVL